MRIGAADPTLMPVAGMLAMSQLGRGRSVVGDIAATSLDLLRADRLAVMAARVLINLEPLTWRSWARHLHNTCSCGWVARLQQLARLWKRRCAPGPWWRPGALGWLRFAAVLQMA